MRIVRYGMVGCGMMGQEHLRNLALLPHARVSVVLEPDAGMRALTEALVPGVRFVSSLAALLAEPSVDALVIASPNHCHADQLLEIARTRPVPVLLEKPACTHLDALNSLQTLVGNYPAPLWTAMEYRYMPPIAALIQAVRHGVLKAGGDLQTAQTEPISHNLVGYPVMLTIREHRYPFLEKVGDWNRFAHNTGGTLVEKCCHFFDLMRLIMGTDPIRLFASGGQNHNHLDELYVNGRPDILDNAYVVLDFPDNRRAMLELCMFAEGSRYQEEISVVGALGKVECRVPGPGRFWPTALLGEAPVAQLVYSPRQPPGPVLLEVPVEQGLLAAGDHNGSTFYQHQKFFAAVVAGGPVEVSLHDGLQAVRIGLAAEHSALTGKAVTLTDGPFRLLPS